MTVKIDSYFKSGKFETSGNPEDRGDRHVTGLSDDIVKKLGELCITESTDVDEHGYDTGKFKWFDNGLFDINVSSDYTKKRYTKYVHIQIMPPTATIPQELSDLLIEKGFKKLI